MCLRDLRAANIKRPRVSNHALRHSSVTRYTGISAPSRIGAGTSDPETLFEPATPTRLTRSVHSGAQSPMSKYESAKHWRPSPALSITRG
jgi:hypothetical protein